MYSDAQQLVQRLKGSSVNDLKFLKESNSETHRPLGFHSRLCSNPALLAGLTFTSLPQARRKSCNKTRSY